MGWCDAAVDMVDAGGHTHNDVEAVTTLEDNC